MNIARRTTRQVAQNIGTKPYGFTGVDRKGTHGMTNSMTATLSLCMKISCQAQRRSSHSCEPSTCELMWQIIIYEPIRLYERRFLLWKPTIVSSHVSIITDV